MNEKCKREFIPITEEERTQNLLELKDNFFYFLKEIFGIDLTSFQREMVLNILLGKEFVIKKGEVLVTFVKEDKGKVYSPGYYWRREEAGNKWSPVEINIDSQGNFSFQMIGDDRDFELKGGFFGPIFKDIVVKESTPCLWPEEGVSTIQY